MDRWVVTQDPVSTLPWTIEAKSLSLPRKLRAPARPRLESASEHLPSHHLIPVGLGSSSPLPGIFHRQPEPRAPRFAAAQLLQTSQLSLVTMSTLTKEWCHPSP